MYKSFFKRVIDFSLSLMGIIALSPFLLLVALLLLIAHRSFNGVFFFQPRVGVKGKVFRVVKFKTMNDKKDARGRPLPDAERLTSFGRLIRSLSIDELPQLINVLVGDMSLVGPRPLLIKYLPLYSVGQFRRHEVKPGVTGWAQVNGRNNISWTRKFELDVWYVDHASFWLDLRILFLTMKKVLVREGIAKDGEATTEAFNGSN